MKNTGGLYEKLLVIQKCVLWWWRLVAHMAALGKAKPAGQGNWLCSTWHSQWCTRGAGSSFEKLTHRCKSRKGPLVQLGSWSIWCTKWGQQHWVCSALRREGESSCNLRPPKLQARERQTLLGGTQQRDERQQLPVTARDIPTESGKKIFQYKGDQALAQTTQRSCVLFALWDSWLDKALSNFI